METTGLPWWLGGSESTCQCRRQRFNPWIRKIPWRRKWQPTPGFLPGKFPTVHRVAKSQIWLSTSTPLDLNLGEFVRFIQKNRLRGRSKRESWKFKGRESLTKGSQLRGRWKRIELKSAWYEKGNSVEMKKQASWEEEKGNRKKWAQNRRTEEELSSLASPSVSFHNTLTYLRSFYLIIFLFYFLYKVSICCMSFRSCCIGSSWKKTFWFCT